MLPEFLGPWSEYDKEFFLQGLRGPTFKAALQMLYQSTGDKYIVETGCQRLHNDFGAGESTRIFGKFITDFGGRLTTIDINPANMDVAKEVTINYKDRIEYITEDSLVALKTINGPISLLYLDSMDCNLDRENSLPQEHQLKELKICMDKLDKKSIVLLDDNNAPFGGKTAKTNEYLYCNGFYLITSGFQALWTRR